MDPQLRLLFESVYEALENAGIPLGKVAGTDTSVFTGCWGKDYHELQVRDPDILPASFLTGNGTAMLSNRISHFFDLQGASMSIDTGCSSGLVALHQACRSILWGESNISVVAASSVMLNSDLFVALSSLSMTGADGKCYAWDSRAQGYGRGEGVASLILKPLDAAMRDGDHIHALVRETGLNQDGKTKTLTSPSVAAQVKLIEQCYKRAGLSMSETGYVEAHMTGTLVGDLAEAEALAKTFGKSRTTGDPVFVGSIKTNVGHTEPVSGLAAVIKTAWVLKRQQIPPNLNYKTPNPKIPLQEWNLKVPTSLTKWPKDKPLRASINNFGYGGANAHVILEASPETGQPLNGMNYDMIPRDRVFVVSANDSVALKSMMANLARHVLTSVEDNSLNDLAYTLSERRSRMSLTAAVRASSVVELSSRLNQWSRRLSHSTRAPRLGFVFNGQGAQWHAMGRELIASYPLFACLIQKADEVLRQYGSTYSLCDELMRDDKCTRVSEVNLSQPITVALQLCLVDLLRSWGITPSAVTSHSSGEIAAAYSVGRLSFDEALGVAYWRGELAIRSMKLQSLPGGMMAVRMSPDNVAKYLVDTLGGRVIVACVNSPTSVTLSGDTAALEEVSRRLKVDGVSPTKLSVPLAYHSHHMMVIADEYTEHLKTVLSNPDSGWSTSGVKFVSPVTGEAIQSSQILTARHWARNLTNPVLFSQALDRMCFAENGSAEIDMIVEVGAHSTLAGPIRQILKGLKISYASCLQKNTDAVETMLNLVCELVIRNYPVSLLSVNSPSDGKLTFLHDLPAYAWNHSSKYWTEPRISKEIRCKRFQPHELLGTVLPGENGLQTTWRNFLRLIDIPWLMDHQLDSRVVFPSAAYIVMAVEAVRLLAQSKDTPLRFQLRDIEVLEALVIPDSSLGVETQISLRPVEERWFEFTLSSLGAGDEWLVNCKGYVLVKEEQATSGSKATLRADFLNDKDTQSTTFDAESLFSGLTNMGINYGPMFRNITNITTLGNKSVTDFNISNIAPEKHDYVIHPTALDSILQSTYIATPKIRRGSVILPKSIRNITIPSSFSRYSTESFQALTKTQASDRQTFTSEIIVIKRDGGQQIPAFHMDGFLAKILPRSGIAGQALTHEPLTSRLEWELDCWSSITPSLKDSLRISLREEEVNFEKKMMRLSYYLIFEAAQELERGSQDSQQWQPHHKTLSGWMKEIVDQGEKGTLAPRSKAWSRASKAAKQMLIDEMNASENASARLTVRVGKNLARIVRGEVTPLELMMEGNLLNQYYMNYPKLRDRTYKHLAKIAEGLAISRPGVNILEIGAGTGGATKVVLEALSPRSKMSGSGSLAGHYTFTDISSSFFGSAREKLEPWISLMDFRPLNIEADLGSQSFEEGSCDIILASLVLHATKSLHKTMSNVRKLLKPGGKLILIETTTDRIDLQVVFGTLPGWWLSKEPYRKHSPNVSLEVWNKVFLETGFSGIEFEIGDCEEAEFQCTSLIVTSAVAEASYPPSISIVYIGTPVTLWLQQLSEAIRQRTGVTPIFESFDDTQNWNDKLCIFAAEMESPLVHDMSHSTFDKLRRLLVGSQGVLWLSCGGTMDAGKPSFAETYGLLRSLRHEDSSKKFIQLDFSPNECSETHMKDKIYHIVDVFQQNFGSGHIFADQDFEYSVKDSKLYVPRIYPNIDVQNSPDAPPWSVENSSATYLVVGGVGGVGRAVLLWLVEKGAKNVLVVSRAAGEHGEVTKWTADAKVAGCNLQFRSCDLSHEENFVKLLAECSDILPPICGVINAAMGTVLEQMTWGQWHQVTQAKVAISTHLHTHLPKLQFFVLLSSIAGVSGHTSQTNYAAGNTFQDALVRHRTARGQPAVVLDLSAVDSVGWVAQRDNNVRTRIESLGAMSVSVDVVLEMLESAIREPLRANPADSQVIVGLSSYAVISSASINKQDRRFGTLRLTTSHLAGENVALIEATTSAKDGVTTLLAAIADRSLEAPALTQLIVSTLTNKLAIIFNMDPEDIDAEVPLESYGVDSLVAVDLRNWLASHLRLKISVSEITKAHSLPSFATLIVTNNDLMNG
ncbi:Highly reducing polyketide synthase azaB [Lachnellula suecica]|uniref:Highly reducing polyketide synthase azaB n=1 Tax=Lachnellula suecica TaxID=602035 RepID=A0A8T9CKD3_9HELO|nr:Highly reducing polyketide synthase azaB [Lachnellula suecica]